MTETTGVRGRSRCGSEASSCPSFFWRAKNDLFGRAIAPNESERPVGDLLFAGVPFVGPGEKNRSGQTAAHDAVDVPAEHFGLLVFAVANRVHPEFAEHERFFFRQILQSQQILFEIALVVQVNVETAEIDILRQEIFCRRITRVGKENIRIASRPTRMSVSTNSVTRRTPSQRTIVVGISLPTR